MSDPKIILPNGGSSTIGVEKTAMRNQLARDVLLVILARADIHVSAAVDYTTSLVRFAVKIADDFTEQTNGAGN